MKQYRHTEVELEADQGVNLKLQWGRGSKSGDCDHLGYSRGGRVVSGRSSGKGSLWTRGRGNKLGVGRG